jgi:hypothetical protein
MMAGDVAAGTFLWSVRAVRFEMRRFADGCQVLGGLNAEVV